MFIPPNSTKLLPTSAMRIAIQGEGGTGKSTSALTFPNPIILDIDNSVNLADAKSVGVNPDSVHVLPFYDESFLRKIQPGAAKPNPKDSLQKWLEENLLKFTPEQTVVLDSWTFLQDAFDKYVPVPIAKQSGAEDWLSWWAFKIDYSRDILNLFQRATCNVVVIFHEVKERDDKGRLTGKVTPMMQGRFADKLINYFTFWFRQIACEKIESAEKLTEEAKKMCISPERLKQLQSYSSDKTLRAWQTVTTSLVNCKSKIPFDRFIPATYEAFRTPEKFS